LRNSSLGPSGEKRRRREMSKRALGTEKKRTKGRKADRGSWKSTGKRSQRRTSGAAGKKQGMLDEPRARREQLTAGDQRREKKKKKIVWASQRRGGGERMGGSSLHREHADRRTRSQFMGHKGT